MPGDVGQPGGAAGNRRSLRSLWSSQLTAGTLSDQLTTVYILLEPEVAGGWGDKTVADRSVHPPLISSFHYHFDGWLGDDLLESFPCFIVTERLATELDNSRLSGFDLADVDVSRSSQFEELYPGRDLPRFRWLRVHGVAGLHDFGLAQKSRLVVSSDALALLERFQLEHADRAPFVPGER